MVYDSVNMGKKMGKQGGPWAPAFFPGELSGLPFAKETGEGR